MKFSKGSLFITGVAGFLGRYVAQFFTEQGWSVTGIDSLPPENAPLANLSSYYRLVMPNAAFGELLHKHPPDVCIHCAGGASVGFSITDPLSDYYAGPVLTFEILNSLHRQAPQCRFVFLSSAAVYGEPLSLPVSEECPPAPISPYGFHKLQAEYICHEFSTVYGMQTASVRIFSAYGPGLRRQVLWDICRLALTGKALLLQGTGRESRDFIHARDIAKALNVVAASAPMTGESYNLATGGQTTIAELAGLILKILKKDMIPVFNGKVPEGTPLNWQADIGKIRSIGFMPDISLEEGIRKYAEWSKAEILGM